MYWSNSVFFVCQNCRGQSLKHPCRGFITYVFSWKGLNSNFWFLSIEAKVAENIIKAAGNQDFKGFGWFFLPFLFPAEPMAKKFFETIRNLYQDNSQFKWVVLGVSVLISIASIYYTNILVNQLKARERAQWVCLAAIQYISNENDNAIFVLCWRDHQ